MAAPLLLCTSLLLHVHIPLWRHLSPGGVAKGGVPAAACGGVRSVWGKAEGALKPTLPFCLGLSDARPCSPGQNSRRALFPGPQVGAGQEAAAASLEANAG